MEPPHLFPVIPGLLVRPAFGHGERTIQEAKFPLINCRRIAPEPACQRGATSLKFRPSSATFALNSGACCLHFDACGLFAVEDQQTAEKPPYVSVRHTKK